MCRPTSEQSSATITILSQWLTFGSKSLETFEEEWSSVKSSEIEGTVVTVDCSASQALCRELDVVSFPTVRLHRQDGQVERYRGARKAKEQVYLAKERKVPAIRTLTLGSSIIAYSQRMSRPAISLIDAKNASSFTAVDDVVVVAYLDQGNKGLEERFTKAAEQFRDRYSFAVRQRKGHGASLECQNNLNFEQLSVTDLSDALAIENFVHNCARPLIPEFTRRNELEYSKVGVHAHTTIM